jgi:hypothetical protein
VGAYQDQGAASPPHGFLLERGSFTTIDVPRARATALFDVNNRGQMVGIYATNTNHGFLLEGGVCRTIDPPGATFTQPTAINRRGQVVGFYVAQGTIHGFRLDPSGRYTTLDAPGAAPHTLLFDIDDRGRVVGFVQTQKTEPTAQRGAVTAMPLLGALAPRKENG